MVLLVYVEVMKGLWAKKCAKMKKYQEADHKDGLKPETIPGRRSGPERDTQVN